MIPRIAGASLALLAAIAWSAEFNAQQRRAEIKKTLFVSDPPPPLAAETYGRFDVDKDVIAERVTYSSEFGMRTPAILYLPKTHKGKIPALIVVNGHGGDKYSWYAFYSGVLYARAGAAVLTYDPVGEGERNKDRKSGTRAHDRNIPPPEMARRMSGLMITDVMQAVSYLAQRPEVDAKRIAAMGYSMGSFVLSLACAVDTRIHTCVLVGGGDLDGPGQYWDTNGKPMCQAIPYQSLQFLGDRPAVLFALHAARGPTMIFNGLEDTVVEIPTHGPSFFEDMQKRTIHLVGSSKNAFQYGFEPAASHRPYFLTRPVGLWLERQLHFPNWSPASVEQMPETHISEWAQTNRVFMDRGYSNEEREGGTRALGTGVPGLSRDQLTVVPLDQWQAHQDRYILENWVKEAKARVTEPSP